MRCAWQRVIIWLVGILFLVEASAIAILSIIARTRKRNSMTDHFPHLPPLHYLLETNDLTIYTYGHDLYAAMFEAIEHAQNTIYLETFIWSNDTLGAEFSARLARRAAEGVQIYVVFDKIANLFIAANAHHFPASIHTLEYQTIQQAWYPFDLRRYARDHRKLLVVDDEMAFVGGFNIGQLYSTKWRDTHLRIAGPVARDLSATFIEFWNANRTNQPAIEYELHRQWPSTITMQRNDPGRHLFSVRAMYLNAIDLAQHHIYLTNPYFIPDRVILDAILNAARRGVDVCILLPWDSNHITADWLARGFFNECLQAGVRIFGYRNAMIHAKTATIDGIWSTIGTTNLDRLSLTGNYEVNVAIRDAGFAALLEQIFTLDLTNADQLDLDTWQQRPWYAQLGEISLYPLRPFL